MATTVVLDVDGTLMDTNYLHTEAWARAFEVVGRRVPRVELHRQIGRGSDLLIREFVEGDEAVEKVQRLHGELFADMQQYGHPLPGAKDLIFKLVDAGHPVWLVTSAKDEELEHTKRELELEGKISGIVNSSDVENGKPAPDLFEKALYEAGASAGDTVAVGDTVWDVLAAKAAGIRTVAVLSGGAFRAEELKDAGATAIEKDCAALLGTGFPN